MLTTGTFKMVTSCLPCMGSMGGILPLLGDALSPVWGLGPYEEGLMVDPPLRARPFTCLCDPKTPGLF